MNITKQHPAEWKAFERWHKLACPGDPLTAEERYKKEGHVRKPNKRAKKAE